MVHKITKAFGYVLNPWDQKDLSPKEKKIFTAISILVGVPLLGTPHLFYHGGRYIFKKAEKEGTTAEVDEFAKKELGLNDLEGTSTTSIPSTPCIFSDPQFLVEEYKIKDILANREPGAYCYHEVSSKGPFHLCFLDSQRKVKKVLFEKDPQSGGVNRIEHSNTRSYNSFEEFLQSIERENKLKLLPYYLSEFASKTHGSLHPPPSGYNWPASKQRKREVDLKEKSTAATLELESRAAAYIKKKNLQAAFACRVKIAKECCLPDTHPLSSGPNKPEETHYYSHIDTGILKGGHIHVHERKISDEDRTLFNFSLNEFARRNLQDTIMKIHQNPDTFAIAAQKLGTKVSFADIPDSYLKKEDQTENYTAEEGYTPRDARAVEIKFEGFGRVIVGNSPEYGVLYNKVKIEVDGNLSREEQIKAAHIMTSLLGMGPIFTEQRPEDLQRIKLAQLFRAFYPKKARALERREQFYELPVDELKQLIEKKEPRMKKIFKKYLDNDSLFKEVEVYPGKKVWSITDMAAQMRANGSVGLMVGVGASSGLNPENTAKSIVRMLSSGLRSTDDRFEDGIIQEGASPEQDLRSGGGNRVFTREINKKSCKKVSIYDYDFAGSCQLLIDLEIVNRSGTYAYPSDCYGLNNPNIPDSRSPKPYYKTYQNGPSLIGFSKRGFSKSKTQTMNEVMIKNRIPPEFIRGISCTKEVFPYLLKELHASDLITKDEHGKELINGKPLNEFIHVIEYGGDKFKEEWWSKDQKP